jgi:hypothetical protein
MKRSILLPSLKHDLKYFHEVNVKKKCRRHMRGKMIGFLKALFLDLGMVKRMRPMRCFRQPLPLQEALMFAGKREAIVIEEVSKAGSVGHLAAAR